MEIGEAPRPMPAPGLLADQEQALIGLLCSRGRCCYHVRVTLGQAVNAVTELPAHPVLRLA